VKFKRQLKAELDINLAPLIDVVFLLLIFFMVTTTFTKESRLTIDLPESTGLAAEEERPEQIEIIISAQGDYAVNGRPGGAVRWRQHAAADHYGRRHDAASGRGDGNGCCRPAQLRAS
jgi:biopolymer transport protein ExbD